ncbi:MAG TPA: ATP-binding protein [Terriglobales bacterium]
MFAEIRATQIDSFDKAGSSTSQDEDMAHSQHASPGSQSFRAASFVELRHTLPSYVEIVSPFIDELMRFISKFRKDSEANPEIELAVREALVNAIVHGNQQDPHKYVYVRSRCTTNGELSLTIEDEGQGFESEAVPDPTSPENLLRTHGRGIYLMKTLMDEIDFEQGGSVVHLRKRANAASNPIRKPE